VLLCVVGFYTHSLTYTLQRSVAYWWQTSMSETVGRSAAVSVWRIGTSTRRAPSASSVCVCVCVFLGRYLCVLSRCACWTGHHCLSGCTVLQLLSVCVCTYVCMCKSVCACLCVCLFISVCVCVCGGTHTHTHTDRWWELQHEVAVQFTFWHRPTDHQWTVGCTVWLILYCTVLYCTVLYCTVLCTGDTVVCLCTV